MYYSPQAQRPVIRAVLTLCRVTISVLLIEQVIYFSSGMNQQSIIGSLDNILESSWIKYLVCAQVVFAAFMLALGMSSRLIVLWVLLLVVSLTSFHLQNGAVLSGFIAARFIVFLAAAAPILLSGGGSFSIRPTGWHINRHPRVEPSDGVSTYF